VLRHEGEEREVGILVERRTVHVGVDLDPGSAELRDGVFRLAHGRVRVVHREPGDEADEAVRIAVDQLRHALVADPCQLRSLVR